MTSCITTNPQLQTVNLEDTSYLTLPDNWINADMWLKYYQFTQRYPVDFNKIQKYIMQFRQNEIEMIIPFLTNQEFQVFCNCIKPCNCGQLESVYGLGYGDLFRAILKTRTRILSLVATNISNPTSPDNIYLELEYVKTSGSNNSGIPEIEYKFREAPNIPDTKYKYKY